MIVNNDASRISFRSSEDVCAELQRDTDQRSVLCPSWGEQTDEDLLPDVRT